MTDLIKVQPLDMTMSARDISVTERGVFRTCRRRWQLETLQNLTPRVPESLALEFGTGIHAALEAYYRGVAKSLKGPEASAARAFTKWYKEIDARVAKDEWIPQETKDVLRQDLFELKDLGPAMLKNYYTYAAEKDSVFSDIVGVEGELFNTSKVKVKKPHLVGADVIRHPSGRLLVPIVDPATGDPVFVPRVTGVGDDVPAVLSMRIDLLVLRDDTGNKGLWIVDHKTTTSSPNDRGVDFEDQITGYCYGVWRAFGIIPRGVIFNYLVKQLPKDPRRTKTQKNGSTLSTAKDQLTLPHLYRAELKADGLLKKDGTVTSPEHADCYSALLTKGWGPFFKRFEVQRNEHELRSFEARLIEEYSDMIDVQAQPNRAYPNPSSWHCPGCSVNRICQAMEDGSDAEGIIESAFMQAPDRKAA